MGQKVIPFLMFSGRAEEAMRFYRAAFDDCEVLDIIRYEPGEEGREGTVRVATFAIAGHKLMCIDTSADHGFAFNPAVSLLVDCDSRDEVDRLFEALSDGGEVFMPLASYPFSPRYAWISDRFGVSWQLKLTRGA